MGRRWAKLLAGAERSPVRAAQDMSRAMWRDTFGRAATIKEDRMSPPPAESGDAPFAPRKSSVAGAAAFKRLLEAYRSQSPGGWSDDRWEQSRHYVGITYVAVHRCAEQFQQGEFTVYVKDHTLPDGRRPVTPDDPPQGGRHCRPYDLVSLLEKPNEEDSFGSVLYNFFMQMSLTGSWLNWMVPNEYGYPFETYSIPTALAVPGPVTQPDFPKGYWRVQPVYPYGPFSSHPTPMSAAGAAIPAQWVMKVKYEHPYLRYDGYSPLTALRYHVDLVEMIDRSRHYSMRRSIQPSAVLSFDEMEGAQPLPEEELERIRAEFEEAHPGPENTGNLFVTPPGGRLDPWGVRPAEMDYKNGWDQLVGFVLGGYGITKPAAGMIEDASYSTLFATMKQLYWQTLEPLCNRISGAFTRHLAPFFGDNLIVEVRCKRIDDHDVKLAKLSALISVGGVTVNELRKELDMPVTHEPWGAERAGMPAGPGFPPTRGPLGIVSQGEDAPPGSGEEKVMQAAERLLPKEISNGRPTPGALGDGALGPFDQPGIDRKKSLYEAAREVMRNGH
jgi:hypothetical protein